MSGQKVIVTVLRQYLFQSNTEKIASFGHHFVNAVAYTQHVVSVYINGLDDMTTIIMFLFSKTKLYNFTLFIK